MTSTKPVHIARIIIAVIIGIGAVGILASLISGNGANNYIGAQRQAVDLALTADRSSYSPAISLPLQRVTQVQLAQNVAGHTRPFQTCTNAPDNARSYYVTVSRIWLFGLPFSSHYYDACGLAG